MADHRMVVLVCGGRDYRDKQNLFRVLDDLHETMTITKIVHGRARGADTLADLWAIERGVPVARYPANWSRYGNSAGPIRNRLMLQNELPDLVVAFPGGAGTADMVGQARRAQVAVTKVADGKV